MSRRLLLNALRLQRHRSRKELLRALAQNNTTGISAENLLRVIDQHQKGEWSEPMSGEEFAEWLLAVAQEAALERPVTGRWM